MNSEQNTAARRDDNELDLFELLATLWAGRWVIALITGAFTCAGIAYALLATQWYESKVVLVRVDNKSLPSGLAQIGALASLAGVANIGGESGGQMPVAVLKSRDLARDFIEQQRLLPVLYAEKWDAEANTWKSTDPDKQPDLRDAVKYFDETVRAVSEDAKTGLVTLSITWKDPNESARWATLLVAQVNQRLREQALQESQHNIEYLTDSLAATNVASLQQAIGRVLESEMQKLLLARGREEFAFRTVDSAAPPKDRIKPRRTIIAVFSLMLGAVLSVFIVWLRRATNVFRNSRAVVR